MPEPKPASGFPTTHWSRVLRAGDPDDRDGRDALEVLCRDYWYPLYAFARRRGLNQDDAGDIVQGFLADLIERKDLAKADPSRGRFRSFLRWACSHYMSHCREHDHALKRGGGQTPVPIDLRDAEGRYLNEPSHDLTAERLFERRWALELLAHVLKQLELESIATGKIELFTSLRPLLEGDDDAQSYREIGESLEMTEGAVKVAVHRLRRRYRRLLREEVARTVESAEDVEAELADLLAALS